MKYTYGLALAAALFLGGCNSEKALVNKADKLAKVKGQYSDALKIYQEALTKKGVDSGYVSAQIGEMYRLQNRINQAEPFYANAVKAGNTKDTVLYRYAQSLKANGKYLEAKNYFEQVSTKATNDKLKSYSEKEASFADKADKMAKEQTTWEVVNFASINTPTPDYSPLIFQKVLYFTSGRTNTNVYKADGTAFTDLYAYQLEGKKAGGISSLGAEINQPNFMKATCTFSKDGKTMVFAMSNDGSKKGRANVDLFMSRKKGNGWSAPELMSISNPDAWDSSPAFSPDGKTLYFSSDRPGGQGGADIYRVTLDSKGKFTKVVNMGPSINTAGEEMFPYVSDDGKLYFSSDGHPGLGNLDIFVASRDEDNKIVVENTGAPINSAYDDFGITLKTPLDGYFTSNRPGGKGDDDIYQIRDTKKDLKIVKFVLIGRTLEKVEAGNDIQLQNVKVKLIDDQMSTLGEIVTDTSAKYKFDLEANRNYTLLAELPGYYAKREPYSTYGKSPSQEQLTQKETTITLDLDLFLAKLKKDETFVLENIYYDFDKFDIKDSAALELDKLVTILQDNPSIEIELSSHTDSRGKKEYNQALSQKRAESAVAYIVSKGIDRKRITAKGYGFEKPIIENAVTEEDHQKNRRTEFKVTKINKI